MTGANSHPTLSFEPANLKPARVSGPVECLGITFESDDARREHYLTRLREGLEELHDKLGGVPFTTVDDAVARMQSLEKWPMGQPDRLRELAERMREGVQGSRFRVQGSRFKAQGSRFKVQGSKFKVQGSKFKVQGSRVPPTLNLEPANLEPTNLEPANLEPANLEPASLEPSSLELLQLWKDEVGFPHGEIEDILNLSDPPWYTACPNPFLGEFVACYGKPYDPETDDYRREPFAVDVSVGKMDPLYKAHSYHTKVPHLAIVPSILHYTEPGDLVLDGFCGSGMTGVAAQWCGTAPDRCRRELEARWEKEGRGKPKWGARRVILNDLSPAATFIAYNYNVPFDVDEFARAGRQLLDDVEAELGWMYETLHTDGKTKGRIEYTVWSEVFTCPDCAGEVVFFETALDQRTGRVRESFPCPNCEATLTKRVLDRRFEARWDKIVGASVTTPTRRPVLVRYRLGGCAHEKAPDITDLSLIERVEASAWDGTIPTAAIPYMHMTHERARLDQAGITHVHHFYSPRTGSTLARLLRKATVSPSARLRSILRFWLDSHFVNLSLQNRYRPEVSFPYNPLTGVYYVASLISEASPFIAYANKLQRIVAGFREYKPASGSAATGTVSAHSLQVQEASVDYVFTDPPFGENIYYADLNFLVESWYGVLTNACPEAIVDRAKHKGLPDYQGLMRGCFEEYYRVLKPGRWMTVVFHNSQNAVWNAIQEAMLAAGFVVADVRTLDKQQGSFKQVTSTAVKQDLVISAYKPNGGLEQRFKLEAGTEEGVWDFVRTHLRQLPVVVVSGSGHNLKPETRNLKLEVIAERQNYLLFDRMVAFHVQRGVTVPLSAGEFYQGLTQRFSERDGMYFLPEQVAEYDKRRLTTKELQQLQLIVNDEASAIQWLKQQLTDKPQTFQEIHPQFMRELGGWVKHEKPLELLDLLRDNFLCYDVPAAGRAGKGEVPSQIHSYLSSNNRELRNLPKDDPTLQAKAKDRWYVPDPNKAADLEKLRERALLREFWEYLPPGYKPAKRDATQSTLPGLAADSAPVPKGKKMRVLRLEAVRAGFKHCWQERDYRTLLAVAQRIPENVLQEDPKLLMWYDQAVTRVGGEG